jgi:hypothetical protein
MFREVRWTSLSRRKRMRTFTSFDKTFYNSLTLPPRCLLNPVAVSDLGCFYRDKIETSLSRLLFVSFTLVEREEYWKTERSWFKMRLGNFAPVSKQLTVKPDEIRADAQTHS